MKLFRNKWVWAGMPVLLIAASLVFSDTARRFVIHGPGTITAMGAKLSCSGIYVMGRSPEHVIEHDLANFYGPFFRYANYEFDREARTAKSSVLGLFEETALYRPGLGCTLLVNTAAETLQAQTEDIVIAKKEPRPGFWPEGDQVKTGVSKTSVDWQTLDAAIDGAFQDPTEDGLLDTRAIIVVHDGRIIAERYATGYDKNTRFLGWSASKAVTSALIGTMVMDGLLNLDDPAPIKAWQKKGDPRRHITLHHLLTMNSGLAFTEPYIPDNDSTNMLFHTAKMSDFVASKPLEHAPGTHWYYSSGTTNLLSRIYVEKAGGSLAAAHNLMQERFFKPAGMTSAVFEPDASGAFVGSSYFYATARDWARFGLLFLNNGRIGDKQILSEEWVSYSRTPIPQAEQGKYGAQFWLNAGSPDNPDDARYPDLPRDYYMASGYNDQHIGIIPSRKAVIVRLGWTVGDAKFDLNGHYARILAALPDDALPQSPVTHTAAK